ncbi:MAG: Cyclic di-GMP phosphodiesterase Gmr [Syntrophorhabdaceae bacterium PtaU1.Bin034]|nr:MAG: Cyclic di-GMP phosphodiesterase Gmr [Syntrophorhabdaceae bacterium PtaU1.Bin034]
MKDNRQEHDGPRAVALVADDEPMLRLLAVKALQKARFEVHEAENGEEAISLFDRFLPDIVMLDVMMPVMDGFSACAGIRRHPHGRHTPVLMVTGLDDVESIQRAYEAGATDFVTKPINWLILGHRVRYMLRASKSMEALQRSEAKNRALLNAVPDLMLRVGRVGELLEFKEAKREPIFALKEEDIGRPISRVLPVEMAREMADSVRKVLKTGDIHVFEHQFVGNGTTRMYESRIGPSGADEALAIVRDITERKEAEKALRDSEERYALASQGANDGLWDWNLKTNEIHFSSRWKAMLGYGDNEIGNTTEDWLSRIHPDDLDRVKVELNAHLNGASPHFESEYRLLHRDGAYRWMLSRGLAVRDSEGMLYRMAGSQTDITERKGLSEQLLHDAFYDSLTKLPNRALFMDRLGHAVARGKRLKDHKCAVLFMDLDRFKLINDSLGHMLGDALLVQTADRIRRLIRPGDTLARLGGDEFVILFEDIKEAACTTLVAGRIQGLFRTPFVLDGHEVFTTVSIGIAVSSGEYERPEELLRDADIAMYRAKAEERGSCVMFDHSMHESTIELLELENDMRRALERCEFRVFYQPIVDLETGRLVSLEALIRWVHPKRGLVPPGSFIPMAEENGLIVPIGEWVLREVCRQVKRWHDGGADVRVAVNLSARQLKDKNLPAVVAKILRETGVSPTTIDLEITESAVINNWELVGATLSELRSLGVRLCLDDFGTGYSSLSYLHRLPVSELKIDRSFLEKMAFSTEHSGIVQTILELARRLKMDVVAEGIETEGQLAQLKQMQCGLGQGYLLARPLDAETVAPLVHGLTNLPLVPSGANEAAVLPHPEFQAPNPNNIKPRPGCGN